MSNLDFALVVVVWLQGWIMADIAERIGYPMWRGFLGAVAAAALIGAHMLYKS
jgi:uncharacterized membrane-anchored protein YjiN (DUF445 family)